MDLFPAEFRLCQFWEFSVVVPRARSESTPGRYVGFPRSRLQRDREEESRQRILEYSGGFLSIYEPRGEGSEELVVCDVCV